MRKRSPWSGLPALAVMLGGAALLFSGCGLLPHTPTLPGLEGTDGLVPVTVHLDTSRLDPLALTMPPQFTPRIRSNRPGVSSHASIIFALQTIKVDVSSGGVVLGTASVPAGSSSISVAVPPGTARVFFVSYLDNADDILASGTATADIGGSSNLNVPIISGVAGVLVINGLGLGGTIGPLGQPNSFGPVNFSFDNRTGGTMLPPMGGAQIDCSLRIVDSFNGQDFTGSSGFSIPTVSGGLSVPNNGVGISGGILVNISNGPPIGPNLLGNYKIFPVLWAKDGQGRCFVKQFTDQLGDSPPTLLII